MVEPDLMGEFGAAHDIGIGEAVMPVGDGEAGLKIRDRRD
jgi:hypothetical protein